MSCPLGVIRLARERVDAAPGGLRFGDPAAPEYDDSVTHALLLEKEFCL